MSGSISPGRPSLDEVIEHDEINSRVAREALGSLWQAADDTAGLFVTLAGLVMNPGSDESGAGQAGAGRALLFANRACVMALLDLVRFHFIEGAGEVRRMLEWMAIATDLYETPGHYPIWLNAHLAGFDQKTDARTRQYVKFFNPGRIQAVLKRMNNGLVKEYQRCNVMMHGTAASQARSITLQAEPLPIVAIKYIDFDPGSVLPLVDEVYRVLHVAHTGQGVLAGVTLGPGSLSKWRALFDSHMMEFAKLTRSWQQLLGPEIQELRRKRGGQETRGRRRERP